MEPDSVTITNVSGVRLIDPEKLNYHREKCHDPTTNAYICPECQQHSDKGKLKFSGVWSKVAMHLWREHRIDMELLRCPVCPQFRAFNRARYEDHKSKHKMDRPYQCDQCDKSFKQERHLKDHQSRSHLQQKYVHEEDKVSCPTCHKTFKTKTHLRNHVSNVHEGLKPLFSCRFCDYTSTHKSNLSTHGNKLFLRNFFQLFFN